MRHATAAVLAIATLLGGPAAARAGDGTALLGLVPDTVDLVFAVDVADARDSQLFTQLLDRAIDAEPGLRASFTDAGVVFDRDVDTVVCGFDGDDASVCVLEGRFPKDVLAKIAGGSTKRYKGVTYATDGDVEVAVVKKRLLLTRGGGIKPVIDLATAKKGKARRSVAGSPDAAAVRALIADTDTRHDLWAVVARPLTQQGFDVLGVSVGATAASGVVFQLRARLGDAAGAKGAADFVTNALAQVEPQIRQFGLGQTLDSVTVTSDGALLEISLTMAESELSTLMSLLAML